MKKIKISVVSSYFDETPNILEESINSVLNQTYKNFEYIIVSDNPKNLEAKEIVLKYKKTHKNIIFIENEKNLGNSCCLNIAIKKAKGEYICITDSDDINFKNRLENQKVFLEKNNLDICYGDFDEIDHNGKKIKFVKNFKIRLFGFRYFRKKIVKIEYHNNALLFGKKNIFIKNKFDENLERSKDFDLLLRLNKKNIKVKDFPIKILSYRSFFSKNKDEIVQKKIVQKNISQIEETAKCVLKNLKLYKFNIYYYILTFNVLIILIKTYCGRKYRKMKKEKVC